MQSQSVATEQVSCSENPLRHIAIIMDGNGRWATKRHLPRLAGHTAGVGALRRVLQCAVDEHIEMLSVYAFSTENWGRPRIEVEGLMRLFWETIRSDLESCIATVCVCAILVVFMIFHPMFKKLYTSRQN